MSFPKIVSIHHFDNCDWNRVVITTDQPSANIECKISNIEQYNEDWGIHLINGASTYELDAYNIDNYFTRFIGSEILNVSIDPYSVDDIYEDHSEYPPISKCIMIFNVIIFTSIGNLRIQLYNIHEGEYKHQISVKTRHTNLSSYV